MTRFLRGMLNSAFRSGGINVTVMQMLNAAEPSIEKSWKGDPLAEATLRSSLGASYVTLSQPDRARLQLERALALFESLGRHVDAADTLFVLGINAQGHEGHIASAADYYRRALEALHHAGKDAPPLLLFRVRVYLAGVMNTGLYRLEEARQLLDEALDLAARHGRIPPSELPAAWTHKGEILLDEGRFDDAEALFHRAAAANSGPSDAWIGLARSSFLKQNFKAAAEFAKRNRDLAVAYSREHVADTAEAEMEWARYRAEVGEAGQAAAQVQAALPGIREVYRSGFLLAFYLEAASRTFNNAGRFEPAAGYAREALEAVHQSQIPNEHPLVAACTEDLGKSLAGQKQYRQAIPYLEQSLAINRALGPAYAHVAAGVEAQLNQAQNVQ